MTAFPETNTAKQQTFDYFKVIMLSKFDGNITKNYE